MMLLRVACACCCAQQSASWTASVSQEGDDVRNIEFYGIYGFYERASKKWALAAAGR
jgi:hypothetical protein